MINYFCEFCGDPIPSDLVISTDEGGEIRFCQEHGCPDKVAVRKIEIDDFILGEKTKEAARLQSEYSGLKAEIDKAIYAGKPDSEILENLNDSSKGISLDNPVISADEFKKAMDSTEFLALDQDQKSSLAVYTAGGTIDLSDKNTKDTMDIIFPAETKSRIAMEELRIIPKSVFQNLGFPTGKQEHLERARII